MTRSLRIEQITPVFIFAAAFGLFFITLAPSVVPGDPGEYQFIPYILGIAHPPGYAFFTILAKVWTTVVRVGSIAYRSNLLAAAAGAWTMMMVFNIVHLLTVPPSEIIVSDGIEPNHRDYYTNNTRTTSGQAALSRLIAAGFGAVTLATATDLWQHSIHANAHIVSAALSATTLYAGLRWWAGKGARWLYAFAFLAALGVAHHPLLAFGAPAYVVFVLSVRPRIFSERRRIAGVILALLLGLTPLLYIPLRAGATDFGPSPNLDAILGHMTARGIRGNLFFFGLEDQPVRLRVFWELLRLQYAGFSLLLSGLGLIWLAWRRRRPFVLLTIFLATNLAFIINTVQDVMAYLLLPFSTIAVLAGVGAFAVAETGSHLIRAERWRAVALTGYLALLALAPVMAAIHKVPRISLTGFDLADRYIEAVHQQFGGKREGAVLLAPWEAVTPLLYAQYAEGRSLDPADVKLVFVASGSANPWVDFVWKHIEDGPIYLTDYRPQVATEGFRLRPEGDWPFYRVVPPPATAVPQVKNPLTVWAGDAVQVLGWGLDHTSVNVGGTVYLTLYLRGERQLDDYYMPYLALGERLYRWTTDSRLNTPWWQPGETIVERYAITVPFGTPPGEYPLELGISNLSQGEDLTLSNGRTTVKLPTELHVEAVKITPPEAILGTVLANINSRVALMGATATARGQTRETPWGEPLVVSPGDSLQVWLEWRALRLLDQSYTVFVHLIDDAGRPWAQDDYTPLGGAFPTFLWIPRWIEGQQVADPYRLDIAPGTPPGDYLLEVGMYGMTSLRRAYLFDRSGNLAGDRYVLGPVRVLAP
jgi:hypothetical protein